MVMGGLGQGSRRVLPSGLPQAIPMGTEKGGHYPADPEPGPGLSDKGGQKDWTRGPGGGSGPEIPASLLFWGSGDL